MNPESESLIQCYMDGTITASGMARLNAWLRDDAGARREFTELLNLDSAMAAIAADWVPGKMELVAAARGPRKQLVRPAGFRWLVAAACLALLAGAGGWWQTQRVFATVVKDAGVETLPVGADLRGGTYDVKAGTVELLTKRGARLVIEAPAKFRFASAQQFHLMRGRLSAEVPPAAKGFTVVTPSGEAVDLGTRFGVDVPAGAAPEIHVFEGEVIAKATGSRGPQSLRGGEAMTLNKGAGAARGLRSSAFIAPAEMTGLSAALAAGQQARSDAALAALQNEGSLIARLDFESGEPHPGVFRMVQGRWPGSRAPEFVNIGDHLKLDIGGDRAWPQLTLAAWVRLDRLGAPFQSLLHTDGWNDNHPGQVHWMVTHHMTMRLALFGNTLVPGSGDEGFPDSRTSVLPEQGRWAHLANVYDSVKRTVRFYLNGQFDKETRQATAHPARLGPAQIGNWNQQDRKLSGRIDELILLGRAMSDEEVRALFEAGNPYR